MPKAVAIALPVGQGLAMLASSALYLALVKAALLVGAEVIGLFLPPGFLKVLVGGF